MDLMLAAQKARLCQQLARFGRRCRNFHKVLGFTSDRPSRARQATILRLLVTMNCGRDGMQPM